MNAARFGQLSHVVAGGFRVTEVQDVDEDVAEPLIAASDAFPWPVPATETGERPYRLVYDRGPGGVMVYRHTIPADDGEQAMVFAHLVLDSSPVDGADVLRPADVAASVDWLRPFGRPEVRAAMPPRLQPRPGAATDRFEELPFLQALIGRGGLLAVLLDALCAALGGGPKVVLGLADVAGAMDWIAAVGRLMSPGTARRLCWSTLERAETLDRAKIHLAVVPREDLDRAPQGAVVLDELGTPGLGDLGGKAHRAANGVEVVVTPWSGMAVGVLGGGDLALARRVLEAQDEVAVEVGDRDLDAGWPMAVAVTAMPEPLADADAEARMLAEAGLPVGRDLLVLERVARRLLERRLGVSAGDAWRGLQELTERDSVVLRELAVRIYVERALLDEGWLLRSGGVPVPAVTDVPYVPDAELVRRGFEAVDRMVQEAKAGPVGDPGRFAAVAVRLVDFLDKTGLLHVSGRSGSASAARQLLEIAMSDAALHATRGPELVTAVGWVDEAVRRELLVPIIGDLVASSPQPLGNRVSTAVLAWLHPEPPQPTVDSLAHDGDLDPLVAEIAAQSTALVPDPSAFRIAALWTELLAPQESAPRMALLAAGPPFAPSDLARVVQVFGPRKVLVPLVPTLLSADRQDEVVALADGLLDQAHGLREAATDSVQAHMVLTAAELWQNVGWWQVHEDERRNGVALAQLERAQLLLAFAPHAPLGRELWSSIAAAQVVDALCRPIPDRPREELDQRIFQPGAQGVVPIEAYNMIWAVLENGAVADEDIVVAALHGTPEPLPGPPAIRRHRFAQLTLDGHGQVLDAVAVARAQAGRFAVAELQDRARRRIHSEIRAAIPEEREARRLCADHDSFAERWWAAFEPAGSRRSAPERRSRPMVPEVPRRDRGVRR
jgi:GTPase-associated protein 1, middle domain